MLMVTLNHVGVVSQSHPAPAIQTGISKTHSPGLLHSHWSRKVEAWLSLVESFTVLKYFQGVATPALLCLKEPAFHWFFMAQG